MRLSHALALSVLLIVPLGQTLQAKTRTQDDGRTVQPDDQPTTRPTPTTLPAEEMLNRMLQSRPDANRPLTPGDAVVTEADHPFLRKEGDVMRQRVGRLVRTEDGKAWEFHYEADGKTLQDPPMGVLPNGNLAAMETTIKKSNREVRFIITGVTTVYKGHNYILIDRAEVMPD